jgi:hypothetical protein
MKRTHLCLWTIAILGFFTHSAFALIEGGEGNTPINDPGWPKGAAEIFNHKGRTAWWVGPPFGGGEWHSECKGDAAALNDVLRLFAKIEGPKKRLVVLDGIGYSFWLDPNGTKRGDRNTKIDWSFSIWQAERWKMQKGLPAGVSAIPHDHAEPISTITVHTAALRWSEVQVPDGIEVIDNRMEAHGFKLSDGRVIEGQVTAGPGKPLQAKIRVEEIIQKKTGGYDYQVVTSIEADEKGHWAIKNFGEKWCRLIVECDGYASRIAGHVRYDRQPGWEFMGTDLSPQGSIKGRVVDDEGQPLADVNVAMRDLVTVDGDRYDAIEDVFQKTGSDGTFHFKNVPHGKARLTGHRTDFFFPGLGQPVTIPGDLVELRMSKAAALVIRVEFSRDRGKKEYIANLSPEGGDKIGSWGGSAKVDDKNTVKFNGIPPGNYVLKVHSNPSSEGDRKKEQTIELKGGEETTVVVKQDVADE